MAILAPIGLNAFELFTGTYLTHFLKNRVPDFHREWYAALDDDSIEFLAIEAGRASAKSTIASVAAPLYYICERDWEEIQTFSESGGTTGLSTKWMKKIKAELDGNDLLRHDYGIQRGDVWTNDHIQVIRGDGHVVDVYSRGKHSAARGSRGLVLVDDPQSEKDCRSETVLQADEDWFFSDILPILLEGQRCIFIGTPMSPLALLSKVTALPEFKTLSFPSDSPPGSCKSVWPEQWSDEYLAKRLSMMGRDRYMAEYSCRPRVSGNPVFRSEWFPSFDLTSLIHDKNRQDGFRIATGMDCAESKSTQADYTTLVTLGATYGDKPDVYVLDVRRDHWSTKQGAEQVLLVFDEYKQHKTVVESRVSEKHGGDAMIKEIRERERIYNKYVNLYPTKPENDKVSRAMKVQSICQEGRVYIDRHNKDQQLLLSELTMFTGNQNYHDDLLDAFVMALTALQEIVASSGAKITSGLAEAWG